MSLRIRVRDLITAPPLCSSLSLSLYLFKNFCLFIGDREGESLKQTEQGAQSPELTI